MPEKKINFIDLYFKEICLSLAFPFLLWMVTTIQDTKEDVILIKEKISISENNSIELKKRAEFMLQSLLDRRDLYNEIIIIKSKIKNIHNE